jgi:hypothetical protein
MAKADLELAIVKAQSQSPLTSNEMLELLEVDVGTLLREWDMDLYQAEGVLMWRKHEALRWTHQLVSFPVPLEEARRLSLPGLNKIINEYSGDPAADGARAARHEGQVDAGWLAQQINDAARSIEDLYMDAEPALVQQDRASLANDLEKLMNDAYQLAAAFDGLAGN